MLSDLKAVARTVVAAGIIVLTLLAPSISAEDWAMGFHDAAHTGTSSEVVTPPLTLSHTFRDTLPEINSTIGTYFRPIYYRGKIYVQGGLNMNRIFCVDPASGALTWVHLAYHDDLARATVLDSSYPGATAGRILYAGTDQSTSLDATLGGDGLYQRTYDFVGAWPNCGVAVYNGLAYMEGAVADDSTEQFEIMEPLNFVGHDVHSTRYWYYDYWYPYHINQQWDHINRLDHIQSSPTRIPAVADGVVYENRQGKLTAHDANTGAFLWVWDQDGTFGASPAYENGTLYFYNINDGKLYALDAQNAFGDSSHSVVPVKWSTSIAGAFAPIVSKGVVYVGSSDGKFYAIDAVTGGVKWSFQAGSPFSFQQMPAISGNLIYVPSTNNNLYVLNLANGSEVWRYAAAAPLGAVIIGGGRVYASDSTGQLYIFNPANGGGPVVTSFSKNVGDNGAASSITIAGSGFTTFGAVTSITLDDPAHTALTGYSVAGDASITGAIVPAGVSPGAYHVLVTIAGSKTSQGGPLFQVVRGSHTVVNPAAPVATSPPAARIFNTSETGQRHLLKMSDGNFAAVYCDGNSIVYSLGANQGSTWSAPVVLDDTGAQYSTDYSNCSSGVWKDANDNVYVLHSQLWLDSFGYDETVLHLYKLTYRSGALSLAPGFPKSPLGSRPWPIIPRFAEVVKESGGRLWTAYSNYTSVEAQYSDDDGDTWSASTQLNTDYPNSKGALMMINGYPACFVSTPDGGASFTQWNGSSWSAPTGLSGAPNASVVVTNGNNIHVAFDYEGLKYIFFNGSAWSDAVPIDNNGLGASLATDGTNVWCFYTDAGTNLVFKKKRAGDAQWPASAQNVTNDGNGNYAAATTFNTDPSAVPVLWTQAGPSQNYVRFALISSTQPQTFNLTVNNGSGSGSYTSGTVITISANAPPASQTFSQWVGAGVANALAQTTTLTLRADTTVTATYVASAESPYGGTPWPIPGTIQAENFDNGGEGVAYHDSDAGNTGGVYRGADVDIRGCVDASGGYQVGWTAAGEWLKYTVNVTATGNYVLTSRVASGAAGAAFHIEFDGSNVTGSISVPNTGSWDTWQSVTQTVNLSAGQHRMRIVFDIGGFDINYVQFSTINSPPVITSAAFASPNPASVNQSVTFNVAASDLDGDTLTYSWNFGDGATAQGASATHAYTSSGAYSATVTVTDGRGGSASSSTNVTVANTQAAESPYGGNPWPIPGTIEAENYDNGGEGVAYHDSDAGNTGGGYRNDDVDIRACSDTNGGFQVGWTAPGEWLNYTVNVAATGNYTLTSRITTGIDGCAIHVEFDGANVSGSIGIPNTGGWNTWQSVTQIVRLNAGQHTMRIVVENGGFDINYVQFNSTNNAYGGKPWSIPGTIEAENYDNGGEGVAYHDSDAGNTGFGYRKDDVDIRSCSDTNGGFQVGWTASGEWLNYTVNVAASGNYTLTSRIATGVVGGAIHLEFDGANVTGAISIPNTGGWNTWQSVTQTVKLSAGRHTMRIVIDIGGFDINYVQFNSVQPGSAMTVFSLSSAMSFKTTGRDTLAIQGSIPDAPAFDPAGQIVGLDINGVQVSFVLDAKGVGKSAQGTFALKLRAKKDAAGKSLFVGGVLPFTLRIQQGAWSKTWNVDAGKNAANSPMSMPIALDIGTTTYSATVQASLTAKSHIGGKLRK